MAKKSFATAVKGADKLFSVNDTPLTAPTEPSMRKLQINSEFKKLIPPLSIEEYIQLEQNLKDNGIREPISTWGDTIIDGHNRYEIAQKYNLPYSIINYEFENNSDVIVWIINNQLGRRNLSAYDRSVLALRLKPVISEKAKEQQLRKPADFVPQKSAEQNPIETRRELAEIAGVSHDTISKVEKIEQCANPEVISQLKRGDISINKAYQDIKKQKKHEKISASKANQMPYIVMDSNYDVIYCDFPWESNNDITAIEIPYEENAILFMWATTTMLTKALKVMTKWGFIYHTCAVWDKQIADTNDWLRGQHELLLIGIKGKYTVPFTDVMAFNSVYSEKCGEYSKKPDFFYSMIEKMCPGGKYLEVFAQKEYSSKWSVLYNPISKEVGAE